MTSANLSRPGPFITFANPAFEDMSGYSRAELIGRSPRILQGLHTDIAELGRMRKLLDDGRTFEGEIINYRRHSGEYLMAWTVAPVRNDAGEVARWLSVQNDIGTDLRARRTGAQSRGSERPYALI